MVYIDQGVASSMLGEIGTSSGVLEMIAKEAARPVKLIVAVRFHERLIRNVIQKNCAARAWRSYRGCKRADLMVPGD